MKKSRLHKLIDDKLKVFQEAPKIFSKDAIDIENRVLDSVIGLLDKFTTKDGKIDRKDRSNTTILNTLNKRLKNIFKSQPFKSVTGRFVKNFDTIEGLSNKIHSGVNDIDISKLNLSQDKKDAIDDILSGVLNDNVLLQRLRNPLRKILYRHITIGVSRKNAENELRQFITGGDNQGFLEKYVTTLTRDSLNRYDGLINQKAVNEFDMNGFRYVGNIIPTSRTFCTHMVFLTGFASDYVNDNGVFKVKDLPKIIKEGEKSSGWIKGTNVDNFFINRGGWGCRHQVLPTVILEDEKDTFNQNVEEDIEEINMVN